LTAVVQRVSRAAVRVEGREVASIGPGLVVLLGLERSDSAEEVARLAERLPRHRFFADQAGKMNLSLLDVDADVLVVSQFTLAADLSKGLRPSFERAMEPAGAQRLYELFVETLRRSTANVAEGVFGAHMEVELVNDGPVTFILKGASA